MKVAYISDTIIIPFDSIEFVEIDVLNVDTVNVQTVVEVHMRDSKKTAILTKTDVPSFKKQYTEYLGILASAIQEIGD